MRLKSLSKSYTIVIHYSIYVIQGHKYFYKTANFIGSELVTRNFLSYTFRDVISNRFTTKLAHTADAALVASSLYIIQLECFSSFYPLKSGVILQNLTLIGALCPQYFENKAIVICKEKSQDTKTATDVALIGHNLVRFVGILIFHFI